MITRYIYTANRQPIGCVVRTDEGKLGYSAMNPKDRRKLSKKLARSRAEKREVCWIEGMMNMEDGYFLPGRWVMKTGCHPVPARIASHLTVLAALGPKDQQERAAPAAGGGE